jgi:hypothetical protein
MTDIVLTITIPDAKLADVLAALRWQFGAKPDGTQLSQAEIRAKLRESMASSVQDIYTRYKREEQAKQPIDTDAGIS